MNYDSARTQRIGLYVVMASVLSVIAHGASAHDLRICPQWLPINPDKPLKATNDGNIELAMLNMRFIAKPGQTDCSPYAGHPNSCERVIFQWSRRYDVFPFPIGNRLESRRVEYVGGIPAEAICQ